MAVKSKAKISRSPNGRNAKAKVAAKKPVARKTAAKKTVAKKVLSGFVPTKLKLRRPVPSDIDIAQEAKLKPILQVARGARHPRR